MCTITIFTAPTMLLHASCSPHNRSISPSAIFTAPTMWPEEPFFFNMREICSKTRYSTARYNARQKPELGLDIRRKVPFYSKHLFIRYSHFEFGPPWVYYIFMYMYMYECGIKSSKHSNHQWTLCRTSFLIQWGIAHKVHKTFKACEKACYMYQ